MQDLLYKVALSHLTNFGPVRIRYLISHLGSIEAIFKESKKNLAKVPYIGTKLANALDTQTALDNAKKELEILQKNEIKVLFYLDDNFPKSLLQYDDLPIILYIKGQIDLTKGKYLSIVGTRSNTSYGQNLTNKLIEDLAQMQTDVTIVSGLAYGIDYIAHTAALKNNLKTIGCLGHGLGFVYPAAHRQLYKKVTENGALLSEFPFHTRPHPSNFVRRNRIIAALSKATIVVESSKDGGAMLTAEYANSYNREVMTFPGRVGDKISEGCNYLIKTNKAALIENAEDVVKNLNWTSRKIVQQPTLFPVLEPDEQAIYDFLKANDKTNIDVISYETNIPINRVMSALFQLEFKNLVISLPGRIYQLKV